MLFTYYIIQLHYNFQSKFDYTNWYKLTKIKNDVECDVNGLIICNTTFALRTNHIEIVQITFCAVSKPELDQTIFFRSVVLCTITKRQKIIYRPETEQ